MKRYIIKSRIFITTEVLENIKEEKGDLHSKFVCAKRFI